MPWLPEQYRYEYMISLCFHQNAMETVQDENTNSMTYNNCRMMDDVDDDEFLYMASQVNFDKLLSFSIEMVDPKCV